MFTITILATIQLLCYGSNNNIGLIGQALQRIILKSICNLVDDFLNFLNIHRNERLRGGDLHHRPRLLLLCFGPSDEAIDCPEHLASG